MQPFLGCEVSLLIYIFKSLILDSTSSPRTSLHTAAIAVVGIILGTLLPASTTATRSMETILNLIYTACSQNANQLYVTQHAADILSDRITSTRKNIS